MSCPGEKSGGTSGSSKCTTGGVWHDLKRFWHASREEVSASFMKGLAETWHKKGELNDEDFNILTTALNRLTDHLQKKDFTDEDAEKADQMVADINGWLDQRAAEQAAAEKAAT